MPIFNSNTINLTEFFKTKSYTLHIGQRRYEWDTDNVEELIDDIIENTEDGSTYFIGDMVITNTVENDIEKYSIVEGQQRAITLFLIFLYARNYFYRLGGGADNNYLNYSNYITNFTSDIHGNGVCIPRLQVLRNDNVIIEKLCKSFCKISEILSESDLITKSHKAIQNAIVTIENKLDALDQNKLKKFLKALTDRVEVSVITTSEVSQAWILFTNSNIRGKRPGPDSTLKNLIFSNLDEDEYDRCNNKWDEFINELSSANKKDNIEPVKFLKHYIMSKGKYINSKNIYNYFEDEIKNQNLNEQDIENLIDDFKNKAKKYKEYKNCTLSSNKSIYAIKIFGLSQALIVLMAAYELVDNKFNEVCKHLERIAFIYSICGIRTNKLESKFVNVSDNIQKYIKNNVEEDYNKAIEILKNSYSGYENKLIESLENYKMLSGETSKNKTKYILNEISYLLNNAYYNEHTTEHIMPIKKERNWNHIDLSKEEYKKIINKLGNLTLITSEDNSAIKDESFEVKSSVYRNYQNKLTSSIVQEIDISIGSTNIRNILTECQCPEPVDDWTPINIQNRTKWMAELARYIWF